MLHYTKVFSGHQKEWIVFLHGLGGKSTLFYKQADFFSKRYNVLFIDLPGHGDSEGLPVPYYEPAQIVPKITEVLDKLHISKAHFFAFSVGSIIGNALMLQAAPYIRTMTLAGPVLKFNSWTKFLIESAWRLRSFAPYMVFYQIFAYLIMPRKAHAKSRMYFVREAANLGRQEFIKWTHLLKNAHKPYEQLKQQPTSIPLFYLIGKDDHLFLDEAKKAAAANPHASLQIVEGCGHVCIIEQSAACNEAVHAFIEQSVTYKQVSSL